MIIFYLALVILFAFGGTVFFLYLDFTRQPAAKWKQKIAAKLGALRVRVSHAQNEVVNLPGKCKSREKDVVDRERDVALQREPIESLKGHTGIGPGTIDKLRAHGFASVQDITTRRISIPGLGDKRIGDIQVALNSILHSIEKRIKSPSDEIGRSVAMQILDIRSDFDRREVELKAQLDAAAITQRELSELKKRAAKVTFLNYIMKSPDAIIPDHILKAPLPDVESVFANAVAQRNSVHAPKNPTPAHQPSQVEKAPSQRALAGVVPVFISSGQVAIAGYTLTGPLIYVADCVSNPDFDASLLCLRRQIGAPCAEPPHALGYWPQLSNLAPHQVGNYIQWLADGRKNPDVDMGYVFLYFYGLERRALLDNEDVLPIAYEVLRLLIYHHSSSFRGYATSFFCYLVMLQRIKASVKLINKLLTYEDRFIDEWLWTVIIGTLVRSGEPMPAEWAQRFAAQDERARQSVYVDRHADEFARIFQARYESRFGTGLIPIARKNLILHYRAASPSLLHGTPAHSSIPQVTWPQVTSWRSQIAPLVDVWNESVETLRQAVRAKGGSAALPQAGPDPALQERWTALLTVQESSDAGCLIAPVSNLAEFSGIAQRGRLTLAQSKSIAALAESMGTPVEPDARYTGKSYPWDSHVAVLRLSESPVLPQGKAYAVASILARLALEIANKDGETTLDERHAILTFLEERFMLGANDRRRLAALLDVYLCDKPPLTGFVKRLDDVFNESQRRAVGRFLVDVAAASDGISRQEITALERVFKALGLDAGLVMNFARDCFTTDRETPVPVQTGTAAAGEPIPPRAAGIDIERIRKLREESDAVSKMLVAAMEQAPVKDDTETNVISKVEVSAIANQSSDVKTNSPGNGKMEHLRRPLLNVLRELSAKTDWGRDEAESIVRRHGTTLAAAIEEVNEWSDEHLGDFVLEDGGTIRVRMELLKDNGVTA